MTHVLLAAFSPMLESIIVDALAGRDDVTLVAADRIDPESFEGDVDVILTGASDPASIEHLIRLLWRWPRSRVIVIGQSGCDAAVYELAPRKAMLGDLCPATLVGAVCRERP